jgi:hypothetical protein
VQEIAIEPVGLQPLQRTLTCGDGAAPRSVARQHFRHQENLVALSGDRVRNHQFGIAIHLGGVDVGHAEIDATAQACHRALAIAVVDVPGALPDHRHLRTVLTEFLLSQDYLRRRIFPAVIARLDRATQYSRGARD